MCHSPSHFIARRLVSVGMATFVLLDVVSLRRLELVDGLAHFLDGVDGAFLFSGDIAEHVNHRAQVLAVETCVDGFLLDFGQLADRDLSAACTHPNKSKTGTCWGPDRQSVVLGK